MFCREIKVSSTQAAHQILCPKASRRLQCGMARRVCFEARDKLSEALKLAHFDEPFAGLILFH